jgi:hypothetical protein
MACLVHLGIDILSFVQLVVLRQADMCSFGSARCSSRPSLQGDSVKKGQPLGYVEQLGTFVAVEVGR